MLMDESYPSAESNRESKGLVDRILRLGPKRRIGRSTWKGPAQRRTLLRGLIALLLLAGPTGAALAAENTIFVRIGTGGTGGTYFPIGGLIANAISNPPGSRDCELGGSCGVPGLIAAAVSTQGSVENLRAVAANRIELGLSQADVLFYSYSGKEMFAKEKPLDNLRAIANLYPEAIHLVTRRESQIRSPKDLKGLRVSIGEPDSGTLVIATVILEAYGITRNQIKPFYEKIGKAGDLLAEGLLDAYFMVGGYPLSAIVHTANAVDIMLVPIKKEEIKQYIDAHPFLAPHVIPESTYRSVPSTETLSVGAQIVASSSMDVELAYNITRALWHPGNRKVLDGGHPNGKLIQLESALDGIAIPLHLGAARYYQEAGLTRAGVF
jgi:hypothetical protein